MQKLLTINLNNNILFDRINHGENFLLFYQNTKDHRVILQNFIQQMNNDSRIVHISNKQNELNLNLDIKKISFNILTEKGIHNLKTKFNVHLKDMEERGINLCLIADWASVHLKKDDGLFFPFIEDLIKKSKGLNPPGWKRKYRSISKPAPFMLINIFDLNELKDDPYTIRKLINMHKRTYILQNNLNTFLLPKISPSPDIIVPKFDILPQNILERIVKNNLEIVILCFLEKNKKSGYQILKDIASQFHCILSQGTLYPLLYKLEKEKKIIKENGNGREIVYSLTKETRDALLPEKENELKGYQYLAGFFRNIS